MYISLIEKTGISAMTTHDPKPRPPRGPAPLKSMLYSMLI